MVVLKVMEALPLPEALVYTDGSTGSDYRGGWSAIVVTPSFGIEITGCEEKTTNNRMEMMAAIMGLKALPHPHEACLISDSAYMLNSIKHKWYERWLAQGKERPNLDLWQEIAGILCYHVVKPIKVKGHSGVKWNERVDKLAKAARINQKGSLEVLYGSYK